MLGEPVLILNRSWLPLHVTNVRRAVTLVFKGHAQIVCPRTYQTFDFHRWMRLSTGPEIRHCLRTPTFAFPVPEVAVLIDFNKAVRRQIRFNRKNVFLRDRHTCQYCGRVLPERELTLDHILPLSRGGGNSWENVVLACPGCNKRKANLTPEQAGMRLLRAPARPAKEYTILPRLRRVRESWQPFLGAVAEPALA